MSHWVKFSMFCELMDALLYSWHLSRGGTQATLEVVLSLKAIKKRFGRWLSPALDTRMDQLIQIAEELPDQWEHRMRDTITNLQTLMEVQDERESTGSGYQEGACEGLQGTSGDSVQWDSAEHATGKGWGATSPSDEASDSSSTQERGETAREARAGTPGPGAERDGEGQGAGASDRRGTEGEEALHASYSPLCGTECLSWEGGPCTCGAREVRRVLRDSPGKASIRCSIRVRDPVSFRGIPFGRVIGIDSGTKGGDRTAIIEFSPGRPIRTGKDDRVRQWVLENGFWDEDEEDDEDVVSSPQFMDGYDDCVLGIVERYGQPEIVLYDRDKVLARLEADGMTPEEAREFYEINQKGAWVGSTTPCFAVLLREHEL